MITHLLEKPQPKLSNAVIELFLEQYNAKTEEKIYLIEQTQGEVEEKAGGIENRFYYTFFRLVPDFPLMHYQKGGTLNDSDTLTWFARELNKRPDETGRIQSVVANISSNPFKGLD